MNVLTFPMLLTTQLNSINWNEMLPIMPESSLRVTLSRIHFILPWIYSNIRRSFTIFNLTQNTEKKLRRFAYNVQINDKMCNVKIQLKQNFWRVLWSRMWHCAMCLSSAYCLLGLFFDPEDGSDTFRRNFGKLLRNYMHKVTSQMIVILHSHSRVELKPKIITDK
jgi:hypothetical protein